MNLRAYIWSGVGVAVFAFLLMSFVKSAWPLFVGIAVMWSIYRLMFKRRW